MPRRKRGTRRPAGPARRRTGSRRPARGPRNRSGERIEALLGQTRGRNDTARDHRRPEQSWLGHRTLDTKRDRELFAGLVTLDFDFLMAQDFAAAPRVLMDLLPQSVVGRAQNGHGWFTDEFGTALRFPDATFERVLSILEQADPNLRAHAVRDRRTRMLHGFGDWLLTHLHQSEFDLVGPDGPLFGIDFLADERWDARAFLTGLVLAGRMDDWSCRETSMYQHKRTFTGMPYQIGGGDILLVDRERFELLGLGDTGRTVFGDEQLDELRRLGVICRNRDGDHIFPVHDQAYFRRRMGDGVCDDMALILVGALHGLSGMMGAFVMDAIDTYDKYLLRLTWGGYDGWLAEQVQERFIAREGQPLVGDREIFDLIHFAAKRNDPPTPFSSSHRRLIQVERGATTATVINHWRFLQGQPLDDVKLGFNRVPARLFYTAARDRLAAVGVNVPEPSYLAGKGKRRRV